jgi:hypothetical protein
MPISLLTRCCCCCCVSIAFFTLSSPCNVPMKYAMNQSIVGVLHLCVCSRGFCWLYGKRSVIFRRSAARLPSLIAYHYGFLPVALFSTTFSFACACGYQYSMVRPNFSIRLNDENEHSPYVPRVAGCSFAGISLLLAYWISTSAPVFAMESPVEDELRNKKERYRSNHHDAVAYWIGICTLLKS